MDADDVELRNSATFGVANFASAVENHQQLVEEDCLPRLVRLVATDDPEGKYFKRMERASRNGSTVVLISMTPLSFKPVSLFVLRSALSKNTQTSLFLTYITIWSLLPH